MPDSSTASTHVVPPPVLRSELASLEGTPLGELIAEQVLAVESALVELVRSPEEMVHEARVGLRRLRSSLALYAGALHAEAAVPLRRELSWLAGRLGPARDAQVQLERVTHAVADLGLQEEAGEVLAHFRTAYDEAFEAAGEALASQRFVRLVGRLDTARLRSLVVEEPDSDLAGGDLTRLTRDLQTVEGASDEHLHDLRKAVKRARYVRSSHDEVDGSLKKLQGVLGEHQDAVVARQHLTELPAGPVVDALSAREDEAARVSREAVPRAVERLLQAVRPPSTTST